MEMVITVYNEEPRSLPTAGEATRDPYRGAGDRNTEPGHTKGVKRPHVIFVPFRMLSKPEKYISIVLTSAAGIRC